jgi:anion transporter
MVAANAGALPSPASLENPNSRLVIIGQLLSVLVPLIIWFAPLPLELETKHCFAIVGFMIVAWITRAMEFALTGLIGCFLFWALGVVRFPVAFSGFANDTPWFLFGALLLGTVATRSAIARRLAYFLMLRVGVTYPRILLSLIVTDFLLTFIVPAGAARVVIMASIAIGLADAFNSPPGSNVARGMFLVLTYTANIFDKMIIAGAASITARGLIEKVGGVAVLWSYWFIAFLPCSVVTVLAAWWLTLKLYPPENIALAGGRDYLRAELRNLGTLSPLEKRAAVLMAAAILLWLTDFLHHISPAVIAMGAGLFALLPRVGVLEIEDLRRLNYLPVFFVAAAVSMGAVLEETNGLHVLTGSVFAFVQPFMTNIIMTTIVMYWTAVVSHFFLASEISMLGATIPAGHGVRQDERPQSAAAWHDLDVRRGWQTFRLSIGRPDCRLLVRILRRP